MSYTSAQSAGQPKLRTTPGSGQNDATVNLPVGYSGVISGLSRSQRSQRAIIKIFAAGGLEIFRSILIGTGENKPLTEQIDPSSTGIAFGPFNYEATAVVTIENGSQGCDFRSSTVIAPITVTKTPTSAHPNHISVTTILSEDGTDNDFNDAIISIFAFKSAS